MTTKYHMLVIAGLILALGTAPSIAAKNKAKASKEPCACKCRKGGKGKRFGLTQEQREAMKASRKAQKEAIKPLRKELKEQMKLLRTQVREDASDKEISKTLDKIQKTRDSIEAQREKFKGELESALTPKQRAQLLLAKGKRQMRRHRLKGRRARGVGRGRGQGFDRDRGRRGKRGRRGGKRHQRDWWGFDDEE